MPVARNSSAARPLSEMNTTPLIDVLLVLLVMLILTIPVATHSLEYPLPNDEQPEARINEVSNRLSVSATDQFLWNGSEIAPDALLSALRLTTRMNPEPQLQLAPDAQASYGASAELLRIVKLSGATHVGFVGNERHRSFATAQD